MKGEWTGTYEYASLLWHRFATTAILMGDWGGEREGHSQRVIGIEVRTSFSLSSRGKWPVRILFFWCSSRRSYSSNWTWLCPRLDPHKCRDVHQRITWDSSLYSIWCLSSCRRVKSSSSVMSFSCHSSQVMLIHWSPFQISFTFLFWYSILSLCLLHNTSRVGWL